MSAPATVAARTAGADATRALAGALAGCCRPGDVVLLAGDLGAGKTTFAQGFAAALGVAQRVTSPTFTLVHTYPCGRGAVATLLHADVYRLDDLAEVVDLGLAEMVDAGAVALVEWGDVAAPVLGEGALTVTLAVPPDGGEDDRVVEVSAPAIGLLAGSGPNGTWRDRWPAVAATLAPWRTGVPGEDPGEGGADPEEVPR